MRTFTKLVDAGHFHDYEAYIEKAVSRMLEEEAQVPKSARSDPIPPPPQVENPGPRFTSTAEASPVPTVTQTDPPYNQSPSSTLQVRKELFPPGTILCPECEQPVGAEYASVKGVKYHSGCWYRLERSAFRD